jgi:hypothetical protein
MRLVRGALEGGGVEHRRWPDPSGAGWAEATAIDGDAALVATKSFGLDDPDAEWTWGTVFQLGRTRTVLKRASGDEVAPVWTSDLESSCSTDARRPARLVCAAFDGRRTLFIAADVSGGALTPLGFVPGRFFVDGTPKSEWLTGRLSSGVPVAMDPQTGRILAAPSDCRTDALTVAGDTVGVLEVTGQTTRIRLYSVPGVDVP